MNRRVWTTCICKHLFQAKGLIQDLGLVFIRLSLSTRLQGWGLGLTIESPKNVTWVHGKQCWKPKRGCRWEGKPLGSTLVLWTRRTQHFKDSPRSRATCWSLTWNRFTFHKFPGELKLQNLEPQTTNSENNSSCGNSSRFKQKKGVCLSLLVSFASRHARKRFCFEE